MLGETWRLVIRGRRIVFAACVTMASVPMVSCGGKTDSRAKHDESAAASTGAGGGDNAGAGGDASASGGQRPPLDFLPQGVGGVADSTQDAGPEDECPVRELWAAVGYKSGGTTTCSPWECTLPGQTRLWGAIVFGGDGTVIDVVDYRGWWNFEKDDWLSEFEGGRWPCLADQTVDYCCSMPR